jgi:hypothetical protein
VCEREREREREDLSFFIVIATVFLERFAILPTGAQSKSDGIAPHLSKTNFLRMAWEVLYHLGFSSVLSPLLSVPHHLFAPARLAFLSLNTPDPLAGREAD